MKTQTQKIYVGEMDIEGWDAIEKFPFKDSKEIIGATIAYKFDAKYGGWAHAGDSKNSC